MPDLLVQRSFAINCARIRMCQLSIDASKLRALDWRPEMAWEEGLAQTVRWYQENEDWWRKLKSGEFLEYYKQQYETRTATNE